MCDRCCNTKVLSRVVTTGLNLYHQFQYENGELKQATIPFGGSLRWAHASYPYAGGRLLRGVQNRYFSASASAPETAHALSLSLTAVENLPQWGCITGPNNLGQRCWFFHTDHASPYNGLLAWQDERTTPWVAGQRQQSFTWAQDAAGTRYIAAALTTLEDGTQSKTEQTLDVRGNVLLTQVYDYGNLATPARTYYNVYLTDANYTSRYIFNRLLTATVTSGGQTATLVQNVYDRYASDTCGGRESTPSSLFAHDAVNYGYTFSYRGNVNSFNGVSTPGTCIRRDITGTVRQTDSAGRTVTINTAAGNYGAPGVITPGGNGNLATSLSYSSFLGVASVTQPNGAVGTTVYDGYARPATTTSPHGATTTHTYTNSPPTHTAVTAGRFVKTTYDGIGRVTRVERGHGAPASPVTVSIEETEYGECACSPVGKVKRVSQPYAPGGTVYWTTYHYDALGRTVSAVGPDGASTGQYGYAGNRVTVTDAAGKWKTFTTDVFGNLVKVTEPNPGGGNVETNYTYDRLNNLTQVSMPRGGATQTRTFVYAGRRLTGACTACVSPGINTKLPRPAPIDRQNQARGPLSWNPTMVRVPAAIFIQPAYPEANENWRSTHCRQKRRG